MSPTTTEIVLDQQMHLPGVDRVRIVASNGIHRGECVPFPPSIIFLSRQVFRSESALGLGVAEVVVAHKCCSVLVTENATVSV